MAGFAGHIGTNAAASQPGRRRAPPRYRAFVPRESAFSRNRCPADRGTFVSEPDWSSIRSAVPRRSPETSETQERVILSWVVTFLIIALVAGLLGFGGIAGASIEIAKVIFFIAIVLFLISAVIGLARGRGNV